MAKYEEMKILSAEKVRDLCIEKNWYTRGDNNAYAAMLDKVWEIKDSGKSLTVDQLGEIAKDILAHSDTMYTVESIMWELNRTANTFYFIAEH